MPTRADTTQLRLMVRIARMYYELGMRQTTIASELHVSQSRVSRLLKRAVADGVVRTVVVAPEGTYTGLEEALEQRYGLDECVVVESGRKEAEIEAALASACATYLETTLTGGDVIGLSSWSATWLAAAQQLSAFRAPVAQKVVQLFGGVGNPRVQVKATRLIDLLARATGAEAVFFPSPAVLGSASAAEQLADDASVQRLLDLLPTVTISLVGIGSLKPSALLRESGNMTWPTSARRVRSGTCACASSTPRASPWPATTTRASWGRAPSSCAPSPVVWRPRAAGASTRPSAAPCSGGGSTS